MCWAFRKGSGGRVWEVFPGLNAAKRRKEQEKQDLSTHLIKEHFPHADSYASLQAIGPSFLASAQNRLTVFCISMTICSQHFSGRSTTYVSYENDHMLVDTSVSAANSIVPSRCAANLLKQLK